MIFTAYSDVNKYMERQSEIGEYEAVKLIEKAEEAVGLMTGFAVEKCGLESFSAFEKDMLEKAVFAQADNATWGSSWPNQYSALNHRIARGLPV